MKRASLFLAIIILLATYNQSLAQAIDPQRSAKAAAMSDSKFIEANIQDNEGEMMLAQLAIDGGTDQKVKDFAQLLHTDHTTILYEFEQLGSAGTGSSGRAAGTAPGNEKIATAYQNINKALRNDFDTVWVENVLMVQEHKYNELTQAMESATNPQLQMTIKRALPLLRKHVSQLRTIQRYLAKLADQERKEAAKKAAAEKKKRR